MARELTVIQQEIIDKLSNNGITVTGSLTSIRRLWTYVVAFAIWVLESLFDAHKEEISNLMAEKKLHSLKWYQAQSLKFQFGQDLIPDTAEYANTGLNEAQIAAQKIIAVASVTEIEGKLRIKVAKKASNGSLEKLSTDPAKNELKAFTAYLEKVKDAGVRIIPESRDPDLLKLEIDIWYNPLILSSNGERIDGTNTTPVRNAIDNYLQNLPFNGEYSNVRLIDNLQKTEGVVLPVIRLAQAKYGSSPFSAFDEWYIPDAGYLKINYDADLKINYKPYV